jgi:hypothetical protein
MKKLLFACATLAMGVVLASQASANTLTFDHTNSTYTLTSDNPADQGANVSVVNAYIKNTSGAQSLGITGFEYYLGGSSVSGAAGDTPTQFLAAENGWTYQLGGGAYSTRTAGTGWSRNLAPTPNDAVEPIDASKKNYLSAVTLVNSSSSGYCYTGETLAPGAECYVELLVTANYGGAIGSSSSTFIYGYAEGVDGTGTFNGTTWSHGNNPVEDQGMEEAIEIDIAPEPNSLVLLGTGFGLLGVGLFLRKRFWESEPSMSQPTIA